MTFWLNPREGGEATPENWPTKLGEVEGGREGKIAEAHGAAQVGVVSGAGEAQVGVDAFAHALRVEHANAFGREAEIELNGRPIGDTALGGDCSAADGALKLADVDAVAGQGQHAVAVLQPDRHVARCEVGVDDIDFAAEVGAFAVGVDVEFEFARTAHVGREQLRQLQIDRALQQQRHGRVAADGNGALEFEIGVGAANRAALHVEDVVLVVDVNGSRGGKLNVVVIRHLQIRHGHVRFKRVLVLERAVQRGVQFGLAGNRVRLFGRVGGNQRLQRNALGVERCVGGIVAGEIDVGLGIDRGVHCGGLQRGVGGVIGHVQLQIDLFDGLFLNDQRRNLDAGGDLRIVERSLALGVDGNDAVGIDVFGFQVLRLR